MKYEDLARLKIDVQTDNDRNFLELSILFDKPEFLEWLPKIRNKYHLKLAPLDKYDEVINSFDSVDRGRFDMSLYEDIKGLKEYAKQNETFLTNLEDNDAELYQKLETDAVILCYIFSRPPYFLVPVLQALLCGAVDGDYFYPTKYHIVENDWLQTTTGSFQLPQVVISVSPTSTDVEIKEQVRFARYLLKTDKKLSYYKPRVDKVNKIRAYREWYWQHLAGKTYVQIATEWMDNPNVDSSDSGSDENRILKGVTYYKKLLAI